MRMRYAADCAVRLQKIAVQLRVGRRVGRRVQLSVYGFSVQIDDDHSVARQFGIRDARRLYRKHAFSRIECGNVAPRVHGEIVFKSPNSFPEFPY